MIKKFRNPGFALENKVEKVLQKQNKKSRRQKIEEAILKNIKKLKSQLKNFNV